MSITHIDGYAAGGRLVTTPGLPDSYRVPGWPARPVQTPPHCCQCGRTFPPPKVTTTTSISFPTPADPYPARHARPAGGDTSTSTP